MINAGVMRFSPNGRVVVSDSTPPVVFSGGVPLDAAGAVCISPTAPDLYLAGLGYRTSTRLCAGVSPLISGPPSPLGRDAVGGLALADTGPIAYYYAGIPLVADGRVAVFFDSPPLVSEFSLAFDQNAYA